MTLMTDVKYIIGEIESPIEPPQIHVLQLR